MIEKYLQEKLQKIEKQGLYRRRIVMPQHSTYLNFSSNDYLSFRNDPNLQQAFQEGFAKYPVGSGASMLIAGYHEVHQQLEEKIAHHLGTEKALLLNSGFAANLAVMTLFADLKMHLLLDKAVHASIYEGVALAKTKYSRFLHQNLQNLAEKISKNSNSNNQMIVTEGIFSMSGQQSNLKALSALAKKHESFLFVDEAHAFGVMGPSGLGAVAEYQLTQEEVPLRVLSFGKALGAQGAVIAGKALWIEGILQVAKPYIYSTGMSPALAYGLLKGFDMILQADERRAKLDRLIHYFREEASHSSLRWRHSNTAIQQLQLGCPHKALACAERLQETGIYCLAIRAPTVNLPETGLRVVINAHHSFGDIDRLFQQLKISAP